MNTRTRIENKIARDTGFTLAEALIAILILLMVSAIVAGGIPAAKNAYEGVTQAANAETLLSTTVSQLRNELGTAGFVQAVDSDGNPVSEGTVGVAVVYYNYTSHTASKISKAPAPSGDSDPVQGMMLLQKNTEVDVKMGENAPLVLSRSEGASATTLVPEKVIEEGQYVTYGSVKVENGVVSFKNLAVKTKDNTVLAPVKRPTGNQASTDYWISIRVLSVS